jgi:hypothetical protein
MMLGLLRELGLSLVAATFGAIVFAWSGTMQARLHVFHHYGVLLWLPAMLWAVTRIHRGGGLGAVLGLALATAMTWTAGHPPVAIATCLFAGTWFVVGCARAGRQAFARGAAGFALGLGLAACAIAPLWAYVAESGRDADAILATTRRAEELDPAAWLNLVLESPFSRPALNRQGGVPYHLSPLLWLLHSRAGETGVAPMLNQTEHRLYLGALPILLAVCGIGRRQRWTGTAAMLGTAVLLVLAAGRAHGLSRPRVRNPGALYRRHSGPARHRRAELHRESLRQR